MAVPDNLYSFEESQYDHPSFSHDLSREIHPKFSIQLH